MKIAIFGATGRIGSRLTTEAVERGHHVTAISRSADTKNWPSGVSAVAADVTDQATMAGLFASADVAIVTIRPPAGAESTLPDLTDLLLDAAHDTPILVIGGAGALKTPGQPELLVENNPDLVPPKYRPIAHASAAQLRTCQKHPAAQWTYLSPPLNPSPGERTGTYRRGTNTLLCQPDGTSAISMEDLAVAALDEIESPSAEPHFTVAY